MEAILAGDYKFEPEEYWANVSQTARDFVTACASQQRERCDRGEGELLRLRGAIQPVRRKDVDWRNRRRG